MSGLVATLLGRPRPIAIEDVAEFPAPAAAPTYARLLGELRGVVEVGRLLRASPWLARAPRGHGQVVIDLPGWRAPEVSGAPIRSYLRLLGYDARGWGIGRNLGDPEGDVERLVDRLTRADAPDQVSLVGWSLGGSIAREVAREIPERIACVVSYGAPLFGGPTYTAAASIYGEEECKRAADFLHRRDIERPVQVPITSIFTRRDGIVDWRACIDRWSHNAEHVEVTSTHLGLGVDPDVWWAVAQALSRASFP